MSPPLTVPFWCKGSSPHRILNLNALLSNCPPLVLLSLFFVSPTPFGLADAFRLHSGSLLLLLGLEVVVGTVGNGTANEDDGVQADTEAAGG